MDKVITVITTEGSNPKPLEIGNECVSPMTDEEKEIVKTMYPVDWLCSSPC